MLIRLIYVSIAQPGIDLQAALSILQQAKVHNQRHQITGMLAFNENFFLQGLEGEAALIDHLYTNVLQDSRHHTVTMLFCKEVESRHWPDWAMGFAALTTENRALFFKHSQQNVFNPYTMTPDAVEQMLIGLAKSINPLDAPNNQSAVDFNALINTKPNPDQINQPGVLKYLFSKWFV